jgi:hypothetical protein
VISQRGSFLSGRSFVIICSCAVVSERDIEQALIELLSQPVVPLPTPGLVFRHMSKKLDCGGCAPLAITTIYSIVDKLERQGRACPYACASAKSRLIRLNRIRRQRAAHRALPDAAE